MEARTTTEQELYTELGEEVYNELEHFVQDPAFCAALEKGREGLLSRWTKALGPGHSTPALGSALQPGATSTSSGLGEAEGPRSASWSGSGTDAHQQDSFIVVEKRDAVEAMAYYIAACIVDLPEAQALEPKQLQAALVDALRALKRSRFRRACSWGRRLYRWTTYTYSAVQVYQNPWLMRALMTALWAGSRIALRGLI
ncbi:hypothetical protein Agub_g13316 [Astrephomene gubernaculifera]|uniref:Uncharacterized protein n=1 Tax=Astrephomene gubernaculifera TaxID=47775 RepID=A0AAD3HSI2_9CHLO|nr:hypothetical protein Agub_g13316 [Astrephomene gubernaculifera]